MPKRITAGELSKQINCVERELFNAKVHYDIFKGLMDDWPKHLPAIHQSPLFWNTTMEAHMGAALIRLCRAYDKDESSIHLSRLLRAVEAHADFFSEASFRERHKANPHVDSLAKHPRTLGLAQLQRDREFCDPEQNPIVENLQKWRNFILAHSNYREAVRPLGDFHTRYPLPFSDIETLVMEGLAIVNRYSGLLDAMTYSTQVASNHGKDYQFVLAAIDILQC